jgi:hypothetical protein
MGGEVQFQSLLTSSLMEVGSQLHIQGAWGPGEKPLYLLNRGSAWTLWRRAKSLVPVKNLPPKSSHNTQQANLASRKLMYF